MKDTKTFILRDSGVRDRCKTYMDMQNLGDKLLEVVVRPYKKNRSLSQNNLMWMWLTEIAKFLNNEHGIKAKPEDLKVEFQGRWLGYKSCVHSSGGHFDKLIGTSDLTTPMFTEFLNQIEVYANSELGMQLPHPEDIYYEAMRPDKGVIR